MTQIEAELSALVGPGGLARGAEISGRPAMPPYACGAELLLRPATTPELSRIMKACHARGQRVVVHGGRTGLSGGCSSAPGDVLVSLERMTALEIDVAGRTATAGAGVVIQTLQDAARESGLFFGVDWGGRGSATVGGAVSTNAGGNQVLRYGMMREQVLGLEAVLADGTIVSSLSAVLKNNAGYDLKQLFIGSEGTLGIVTRAVLRLRPLLSARATAMIGVERFEALPDLLSRLEAGLDGRLTSFEVMWRSFYAAACTAATRPPVDPDHAFVLLAEASGADETELGDRLTALLAAAYEEGLVADAAIAKSEAERAAWWAIRDNFRGLAALAPFVTFDVSLPIAQVTDYLGDVEARLAESVGSSAMAVFGHLGDQNIHLIVGYPADEPDAKAQVEAAVYSSLIGRSGSMSAEHGIGTAKRGWMHVTRTPEERALMRQLKACLDPKNILNPDRVLDGATRA